MDIISFFKPTKQNLFLPTVAVLLTIYYGLFSPLFATAPFTTRLIALTNRNSFYLLFIIFIITYLISCILVFFLNKYRSKKKSSKL